tara:strand:+ start:665 stop:832 length:168 start_codon:yes stop_codon:yes gene_type:complete
MFNKLRSQLKRKLLEKKENHLSSEGIDFHNDMSNRVTRGELLFTLFLEENKKKEE